MTDWEKAMRWAGLWTPGQRCELGWPFCLHPQMIAYDADEWARSGVTAGPHDIPCPPPSRKLGFQLLEMMILKLITVQVGEGSYEDEDPAICRLKPPFTDDWIEGKAPDLLTALTKAAAALADKEQP